MAIIAGLAAAQAEAKFAVANAENPLFSGPGQQAWEEWLRELTRKSDDFSRTYILQRKEKSGKYELYAQSGPSDSQKLLADDLNNSWYVGLLEKALTEVQVIGNIDTDLTTPITAYAPIHEGKRDQVFLLGIEVNPVKVDQDIWHFAERILFVTLGAILAVALVSWVLARNFTRRLSRLSEAIDRIQEGQLNVGLPENERDEIDELASRLRQLAASIHGEREDLLLAAIESLVTALEAKDTYTFGHSSQVSTFAVAIAKEFNFSEQELFNIRIAALLHDIGKIGIPDQILHKDGKPSDEEWLIIQQHPTIGAKILSGIPALSLVTGMVLHHHARWDGRGYPENLAREEIPFGARIIAVADSFQAMISDRPYRKGMEESVALAEIRRYSGAQYDPAVVESFLRTRNK